MKKQLLNKILFILLLSPIHLFAQSPSLADKDITGLWKGSLYNDTTHKNLYYEIAISDEKGKLVGYSYTLFDVEGKKEMGVKKIKLKINDDQLIIEDVELIANNYSEPPPRKVRMQSIVNLSVDDTAMHLMGKWSTNRTKEYSPLTGSLQLQRMIDYKPFLLFKKLVELKLDKDLSFVLPEKTPEPDMVIKDKPAPQIKTPVVVPSPSSVAVLAKEMVVSTPEKKKEVIVATNDTKKENQQPAVEKPKPITPSPPAPKRPEQVVAIKEPVKKEVKPPVEAVRKQPVAITPPVVKNISAPSAIVKEPVKTESKISAVVVPPQQKKAVPFVTAAPVISGAAANVSERKMNSVQSVFFESDSLVLTLYDNGDVDGDTVSVLMNGQIIFAKAGLSTKANSKTIYIDKGMSDSLSMVMYAENLGSIPPNTGLLIIMDGEKRYEVRFSADLKTNAAILLRRKKIEK